MIVGIVALFTMLFFGGAQEYFFIEKLEKGAKKFIVDKDRSKEIILDLKEGKALIKAFNKDRKGKLAEFHTMNLDRDISREEMKVFFNNRKEERLVFQKSMADIRVKTFSKINDEEWNDIINLSDASVEKKMAKFTVQAFDKVEIQQYPWGWIRWLMNAEIEIMQVEKKIRSRVKKQMEKTQKEYYLNEQMQAIQKELGERDEFKSEIQELEQQLKQKKLSKEAHLKSRKELKKLKMMQPMSAEATVIRNYIDWVLALPWGDKSEENYDIDAAEQFFDERIGYQAAHRGLPTHDMSWFLTAWLTAFMSARPCTMRRK